MNISNLLKFCILVCTVVLCANNNVEATTNHKVNYKVFQHNVFINNGKEFYRYKVPSRKLYTKDYTSGLLTNSNAESPLYKACADDHNEYNYLGNNCSFININMQINNNQLDNDIKYKFNELYKQKVISGVFGDAITNFEKAVREVFGNDYKVVSDYQYDIAAQYPEKRIQITIEDGTTKDVTQKWNGDLDSLMKTCGLELTTIIEWNGMINNQFNISDLLPKKIHTNISTLILTNGTYTIYYNISKGSVMIYKKPYNSNNRPYKRGNIKEIIDKLSKVGLVLKETYEAEEKAVKQVFGQDFNLHYNM